MNELIKITTNEKNDQLVSARELHEFLEVGTHFKDWFPRMCEYGFTEEIDFCSILSESTGGRRATDHIMKLDMAKEISMIQRTEKGKQARLYFLKVEKAWNTPELIMARALQMSEQKILSYKDNIKSLENVIEEQKPKVLFADTVSASQGCISVKKLAGYLKQSGYNIGRNRLFAWMREQGYVGKKKGRDHNAPTQKSLELGVLETREGVWTSSNGSITPTSVTLVTGKGQEYFIRKYIEWVENLKQEAYEPVTVEPSPEIIQNIETVKDETQLTPGE